jgi:hypothetical protein
LLGLMRWAATLVFTANKNITPHKNVINFMVIILSE